MSERRQLCTGGWDAFLNAASAFPRFYRCSGITAPRARIVFSPPREPRIIGTPPPGDFSWRSNSPWTIEVACHGRVHRLGDQRRRGFRPILGQHRRAVQALLGGHDVDGSDVRRLPPHPVQYPSAALDRGASRMVARVRPSGAGTFPWYLGHDPVTGISGSQLPYAASGLNKGRRFAVGNPRPPSGCLKQLKHQNTFSEILLKHRFRTFSGHKRRSPPSAGVHPQGEPPLNFI